MREGDKKLMIKSRRSAGNEASLLWSLLGVVLFSILHFGIHPIFDFVGLFMIGPSSLPISFVFGFAIAGFASFIYYRITAPKIERYKIEYNERMKRKKTEMRDAHLANLQQKQTSKVADKEN